MTPSERIFLLCVTSFLNSCLNREKRSSTAFLNRTNSFALRISLVSCEFGYIYWNIQFRNLVEHIGRKMPGKKKLMKTWNIRIKCFPCLVIISCSTCCLVRAVKATWVCASFDSNLVIKYPTRQQVLQLMMTRLESKLAQTHVALTGPTRQQVLQLMMTMFPLVGLLILMP